MMLALIHLGQATGNSEHFQRHGAGGWSEVDLEEQLNHLRGAAGVLDIFHAVEHLAETSRGLFGTGTDEASHWLEAG